MVVLRCPRTDSENGENPMGNQLPFTPRLLTAAEVAARLRVPVSWVRKRGSEIPGTVRLGKYIRWNETSLDEFIAKGGRG